MKDKPKLEVIPGENRDPEPKTQPPRERNAAVKPLMLNRNQIDPFMLIEEGHGTARDRDRAILMLKEQVQLTQQAVAESLAQFRGWLGRPWYRRIFRKMPALKRPVPAIPQPGGEA